MNEVFFPHLDNVDDRMSNIEGREVIVTYMKKNRPKRFRFIKRDFVFPNSDFEDAVFYRGRFLEKPLKYILMKGYI